jgi:hypothetical protein
LALAAVTQHRHHPHSCPHNRDVIVVFVLIEGFGNLADFA